eukprot:5806470-Lingulodinium_polyedra.AAC.1
MQIGAASAIAIGLLISLRRQSRRWTSLRRRRLRIPWETPSWLSQPSSPIVFARVVILAQLS